MASNCHFERTRPEEVERIERLEQDDEFNTIVLICLNTMITPLLKKYIPPVAERFYNSLVDQFGIHTQCYPDMLKEYMGYRFKYVYINGNQQMNSLMQGYDPEWDYRVAGAIDLTKLMIWKDTYNQFSECDLGELLDIISNIDYFPSKVRTRTKEVKNVRNLVAHHRPFQWTKEKYISYLNEITGFINSLDISNNEKRQYAEKIEKWKEGNTCVQLVDGVRLNISMELGSEHHEATIHGFSDQQERQTLNRLEIKSYFNHDKSSFGIKAKKKQSIKLDLRADMRIYNSTKSFKWAVHKLLQRVIKSSGVKENDHVGLDVEFVLPKTLTKEQLSVVAESFPGALDRKLEKAILNCKEIKDEVKKWKEIREKTIPKLENIERKLGEAATDLDNIRLGRNVVTGFALFGGLLAAPFTGGASLAASLAAVGLTFGSVTFVVSFVFEKHFTREVIRDVQVAFDIDQKTTKLLRIRAEYFANRDDDLSKRLLDIFPGIILAYLEISFSEFQKNFIYTTAESVRQSKNEVGELRRNLNKELQEVQKKVEEMSQESMHKAEGTYRDHYLSSYVDLRRHRRRRHKTFLSHFSREPHKPAS